MVGKAVAYRIKMQVESEWNYCMVTHWTKEQAESRVEELVEMGHERKDLEIVEHTCWEVL